MQRNADITQRLDVVTMLCLALIAVSWFGMSTLVVSFGHFTQSTRFYEMGVVLMHPATLFVGVGEGHTLVVTTFTLLGMGALFIALAAPVVFVQPRSWLAGWLPLALMLVCFGLLYANGSGAPPDMPADGGLRNDVMRLVNHAMLQAQSALAAHIGIGAGGVLALIAGLLLGVRSTINYAAENDFSSASIRNTDPFSREPASS